MSSPAQITALFLSITLAGGPSAAPFGPSSEADGQARASFCLPADPVLPGVDAAADIDSLAKAIRRIHPNPDWARPAGHFDSGAAAIIAEAGQRDQCTASIVVLASRLLALLADGHSRVTNASLASTLGGLPQRFVWRGDRLVIDAIWPDASAHLGAEILAINGMAMTALMDRLRPIVPHNDRFEFLRYSERYLYKTRLLNGVTGRQPDGPVILTVATGSGPIALESPPPSAPGGRLAVVERDLRPSPIAERDRGRYVRWAATGDVFLLRLNAIGNQDGAPFTDAVASAFAAFDSSGASRIMVDLRGNGGGNGALGPFVTAAIRVRPALRRRGSVLVATDKYTYSAAVTLRNNLLYRGDAMSIGEPAGGWPFHPGDNADLVLPTSRVAVEISSVFHAMPFAVGDRHPAIALPHASDADAFRRGADPLLDAAQAGRPARVAPARALDGLVGRHTISPAHTLELTSTPDGMRGTIYPIVDSWLDPTGEEGVYHLATGLEIRADPGGVAVRLPGEPWRALPRAATPSAWELIAAGNAAQGQQALVAAATDGAPGMDDAGMSFIASQIYADLSALGRPRPEILPVVRAVLEAAQTINASSPFSDFSLTIYR